MLRRMPQMLREILERAIARQPDLLLVADNGSDEAAGHVDHADVVVGFAGADEPHTWPAYLHRWPDTRVMTLDVTGRQTFLYELRPYRTEYGELSQSEIVDLIRSSVETGPFPAERPHIDAGPR